MTKQKTSCDPLINAAAAHPELATLAALVRQAKADAQLGDRAAFDWIRSPDCAVILAWLVPPDYDLAAVHEELILLATPPADRRRVTPV